MHASNCKRVKKKTNYWWFSVGTDEEATTNEKEDEHSRKI